MLSVHAWIGGFRSLARRLLRGLGVERSGRRREPVRRGRAERAGDRSVDRRALRDGQRAGAHLRAGRPVPRAPGVVRAAGVAAGSNRSPLRRCAPAGHSSTERARSRGRASRPGGIRRTPTMRHRASRNTTVIGKRMPNECTERHRGNSIAWSGGRKPRSRRPRIRSRRVIGDLDVPDPAARVHELRAPHTRTVSGLTDTGHREVGRAGFEPATRGLKAPCSNRAELPARRHPSGPRSRA